MLIRRMAYRTHLDLEQRLRELQRMIPTPETESAGASTSSTRSEGEVFAPPIDVFQDDEELVIELELPGVDIERDLEVSVHDGMLTVEGSRQSSRSVERGSAYVTERRTGSFSRSLSLPDGIDEDEIRADYEHGVLAIRLTLPRPEASSPRRIDVGHGYGTSRPEALDGRVDPGSSEAEQVDVVVEESSASNESES